MSALRRVRGLRRGALHGLLVLALLLLVSLIYVRWTLQSSRRLAPAASRLERTECVLSLAELAVITTVFVGVSWPLERRSRRQVEQLRALNRRLASRHRRLQRSRRDAARLAAIVESSGDAILGMDLEGRIENANPGTAAVFRIAPHSVEGRDLAELVALRDRGALRTGLAEVRAGATVHRSLRGVDDPDSRLAFTLSPIHDQGRVDGISAIVRDVRESVQDAERLRASNLRYRLATEGARDILWDWDMVSDEFHLASRWASAIGGSASGPVDLSEWWDRVHPDDRVELERAFEALCLGQADDIEFEHRIRRVDGQAVWFLCRGAVHRDEEGRAVRVAGSLTDISERREQSEALLRRAYFDELTGVANRSHLIGRLAHRARDERRGDADFAVMFLDLDGFKQVNDQWGHATGDELLEQVARRLEGCVREGDLVARMGGDEYAVLLDRVEDEADALRVASRIRDALADPYELAGHRFFTSASVGVACADQGARDPGELLRRADVAMYAAKQAGTGGALAYRPEFERPDRVVPSPRSSRQPIDPAELWRSLARR